MEENFGVGWAYVSYSVVDFACLGELFWFCLSDMQPFICAVKGATDACALGKQAAGVAFGPPVLAIDAAHSQIYKWVNVAYELNV